MLAEAIRFALSQHGDQTDAVGQPFVGHPLRVMAYVAAQTTDTHQLAAAVLHDVVEDTPATIEDITARFGLEVAFLVGALTRLDEESYWDYIYRVAESGFDAIRIKLADIQDNTDERRVIRRSFREQADGQGWHRAMIESRYDPAARYLLGAVGRMMPPS